MVNIANLAGKLAGKDEAPVHFEVRQCLHSVDKLSHCAACHDVCPVGAIQPTAPPTVDDSACQFCRACLPICPVGAFSMASETADLLRCATRLGQDRFEIICQHHLAPEHGPAPAAVRVRGCLAGLGTATYLQLALLSPDRVLIRTDACAECPWGQLAGRIRQQLDQATQLLQAWQRHLTFVEYDPAADSEEQVKRPVYAAGSPPMSRRDLFRMQPEKTSDTTAPRVHAEGPFQERLRLIRTLHSLGEVDDEFNTVTMPGSDFALLIVSDACTACGTCARACPSNALELDLDEAARRFSLQFTIQACLACGVCTDLCPESAIQIEPNPSLGYFLSAPVSEVVCQGPLIQCQRCNTYFSPREGSNTHYCPVCEFREQNPFGSRLPPNITRSSSLYGMARPDDTSSRRKVK